MLSRFELYGFIRRLLSTIASAREVRFWSSERPPALRSLNPDDITNFTFSFVTVVVLGQQLVELMMSINFVFPFLHNAFDDSLVGGEVLEPVDGDRPLKVMKLIR